MFDSLSYVSDTEKTAWFVVGFMVAWFVLQGTWPRRSWTYVVPFVTAFLSLSPPSRAQTATSQPTYLGMVQAETPTAEVSYWYGSSLAGSNIVSDSNITAATYGYSAYDPWVVEVGTTVTQPNLYGIETSSPPFAIASTMAHNPPTSPSDFQKVAVSVNVTLCDYGSYYEGSVPLLSGLTSFAFANGVTSGPSANGTDYSITADKQTQLTVHYTKGSSFVVVSTPAAGSFNVYLSGAYTSTNSNFAGLTTYIFSNSSSTTVSPSPALAYGGSLATPALVQPAYWGSVQLTGAFVSSNVTATTGPTTSATSEPTTQGSWASDLAMGLVGKTGDDGSADSNSLYMNSKGQSAGGFSNPDVDASHDYLLGLATVSGSQGYGVNPASISSDGNAVQDIRSVVNWVFPDSLGSSGPFQTGSITFAGQQFSLPAEFWNVAGPDNFLSTAVTEWSSFKQKYSVAFAALKILGTGLFAFNACVGLLRLWLWSFHVDGGEFLRYLYFDMSDPGVVSGLAADEGTDDEATLVADGM